MPVKQMPLAWLRRWPSGTPVGGVNASTSLSGVRRWGENHPAVVRRGADLRRNLMAQSLQQVLASAVRSAGGLAGGDRAGEFHEGTQAKSRQAGAINAGPRMQASCQVRIGEMSMTNHQVVTPEAWVEARKHLLAKEKEFTNQRDQLSQARRDLPWVRVTKQYLFDGPEGKQTLGQLFNDHSQLVVYQKLLVLGR